MAQETMVQRLPAEQMFQKEINALIKAEQDPIPTGWKMSPKSVLTYINRAFEHRFRGRTLGNQHRIIPRITNLFFRGSRRALNDLGRIPIDSCRQMLSEKRISVPELGLEVPAQKGFSVIATANTRDKGVNEMSAAPE